MARLMLRSRHLALVLLLTACASEPERVGKLTRLDELPEDYGAAWSAWRERDPAWAGWRVKAEADDQLAGFLVDNWLRVLLISYGDAGYSSLHEADVRPFERASAELVRFGEISAGRLGELLVIGNAQASAVAGDLLAEIGRPSLGVVIPLLERKDEQTRVRAVELVGRLPHARAGEPAVQERLVELVAQDEHWIVRARAAHSLAQRAARDVSIDRAQRSLLGAVGDEDVAVRAAAARGLGQLGDRRSVPALLDLLERSVATGHLQPALAAEEALTSLSGLREPRDLAGWRAWWEAERRAARGR